MCGRAPTRTCLKSLKVSPQCSQQQELKKRRWKRGSIIRRLPWCHLLLQSKVDVGTSRVAQNCSVQPNAAKTDWWHILQGAEPLLGHTWNMLARAEPRARRRAPPVAERSQRHSHSLVESGGKSVRLLWSAPGCQLPQWVIFKDNVIFLRC